MFIKRIYTKFLIPYLYNGIFPVAEISVTKTKKQKVIHTSMVHPKPSLQPLFRNNFNKNIDFLPYFV